MGLPRLKRIQQWNHQSRIHLSVFPHFTGPVYLHKHKEAKRQLMVSWCWCLPCFLFILLPLSTVSITTWRLNFTGFLQLITLLRRHEASSGSSTYPCWQSLHLVFQVLVSVGQVATAPDEADASGSVGRAARRQILWDRKQHRSRSLPLIESMRSVRKVLHMLFGVFFEDLGTSCCKIWVYIKNTWALAIASTDNPVLTAHLCSLIYLSTVYISSRSPPSRICCIVCHAEGSAHAWVRYIHIPVNIQYPGNHHVSHCRFRPSLCEIMVCRHHAINLLANQSFHIRNQLLSPSCSDHHT